MIRNICNMTAYQTEQYYWQFKDKNRCNGHHTKLKKTTLHKANKLIVVVLQK